MRSEAELKAAESQLRRAEAKQERAELEQKICSQTLHNVDKTRLTKFKSLWLCKKPLGVDSISVGIDNTSTIRPMNRVTKRTQYIPGVWHEERKLSDAGVHFLRVPCSTGAHTLPTDL